VGPPAFLSVQEICAALPDATGSGVNASAVGTRSGLGGPTSSSSWRVLLLVLGSPSALFRASKAATYWPA
jgi:hypothetical protein